MLDIVLINIMHVGKRRVYEGVINMPFNIKR